MIARWKEEEEVFIIGAVIAVVNYFLKGVEHLRGSMHKRWIDKIEGPSSRAVATVGNSAVSFFTISFLSLFPFNFHKCKPAYVSALLFESRSMLHRLKRITSIYRTINENDYIVTSLLIPEKQNILLPIKKKKREKN